VDEHLTRDSTISANLEAVFLVRGRAGRGDIARLPEAGFGLLRGVGRADRQSSTRAGVFREQVKKTWLLRRLTADFALSKGRRL
jgi:hypothetical protein